jgi:hypothetical protein
LALILARWNMNCNHRIKFESSGNKVKKLS